MQKVSSKSSHARRALSEDGAIKTSIGGQALIEGVMMRGRGVWSLAVREPDGTMHCEQHTLDFKQKHVWMKWPLVRGCVAFIESLVIGYKALDIAARHALSEEEEQFGTKEMIVSLVLGTLLGLALFIFAPALLANLIVGDYSVNPFAWNILDGVVRVAIFIFYVWLIGRMSDIKRMFAYHGAEHKTIHCFEHGLALTPENARSFPRLHVRCGTAFLIMVMIVAIFIYTALPLQPLFEQLGITQGPPLFACVLVVRILLLPLIAGISYEITVRWAGQHPENTLTKIILWPGLQIQYLTTNEPDEGQLECAIEAMKLVLAREETT